MKTRLVAIIAFVIAFNGAWIVHDRTPPFQDPSWYLLEAHLRAKSGSCLDALGDPLTYSPVLVAGIGMLKSLHGAANSDRHVFVFQSLMLGLIGFGAFEAARAASRMTAGSEEGKRAGLVAAFLALTAPGILAAARHASADLPLAAGSVLLAAGLARAASGFEARDGAKTAFLCGTGVFLSLSSKFSSPLHIASLLAGTALALALLRVRPEGGGADPNPRSPRSVLHAAIGIPLGVLPMAPIYLHPRNLEFILEYAHHSALTGEADPWSGGPPFSSGAFRELFQDLAAGQAPAFWLLPVGSLAIFALFERGLSSEQRAARIVAGSGVLLPFLVLAATFLHSGRQLLPALPLLAVLAGAGSMRLVRQASGRWSLSAIAGLIAAGTLLHSFTIPGLSPGLRETIAAPLGLSESALEATSGPRVIRPADPRRWNLAQIADEIRSPAYIAANHRVVHPYGIVYQSALANRSLEIGYPQPMQIEPDFSRYQSIVLLLPLEASLEERRPGIAAAITEASDSTKWSRHETLLPDGARVVVATRIRP